jgi:hypothetical protein
VPVDAIVDAAAVRPLLAKIDVEGSELQVLHGTEHAGCALQAHFVIGNHPPNTMSPVGGWLKQTYYLTR